MNDTNQNNIVTLTGRTPIDVTVGGTVEAVDVRTLPIKDFPAYLKAQDDELAMIAMLTGKPAAWVERLDNASVEALLKVGEEANRDFFVRWAKRRLERTEMLYPGITGMMLLANQSSSTSGLPKSPSPVASPSSKP